MRIITPEGYADRVGLFFELTDEQLEKVRANKEYYKDLELMSELLLSKGDNAHFFRIVCDNVFFYKHISEVLKDYKTISWWDRDMDKFIIKRRK